MASPDENESEPGIAGQGGGRGRTGTTLQHVLFETFIHVSGDKDFTWMYFFLGSRLLSCEAEGAIVEVERG